MTTTLLITHDDLDGAASAIVLSWALPGEPIQIQCCRPGGADSALGEALQGPWTQIVVSDLHLAKAYEPDDRVTVYDHHPDPVQHPFRFVHRVSACSATLLFEDLQKRLPSGSVKALDFFVRAVDAYDRWQTTNLAFGRGKDFDRILAHTGFNAFVQARVYNPQAVLMGMDALRRLTVLETAMDKGFSDMDRRYIERRIARATEQKDAADRTYMFTIATRCRNDVGATLSALEGISYAAIWDPEDGVVHLRSNKDGGADVGEIARTLGGGGHPHAAAFPVSSATSLIPDISTPPKEGSPS